MIPGGGDAAEGHKVLVCTTGKGPEGRGCELESELRITKKKGQEPKVVMALGPGRRSLTSLPDLAPGDLLHVTAEVELTTDSSEPYYRKAYGYDPLVRASLLLASSANAREPDGKRALPLGKRMDCTCTHEAHHSVIVFTDAKLRIPQEGLPWRGDSYVNLVLDAYHPKASGNQVLMIGEHEHVDGKIEVRGGKGRLNVVRTRPGSKPPAKTLRRKDLRAKAVPVDKNKRTVVYAVPLDDLADGEQLAVEASMTTEHPRYPARISTRVLLADKGTQTDTGGRAKDLAEFKGEIGEHNGFNGKGGRFRTRRVGVLRVESPASQAYVNLVADSGDPLRKGKPGDRLRLLDDGFLKVTRYGSDLKG